jgi:hypothetical protein
MMMLLKSLGRQRTALAYAWLVLAALPLIVMAWTVGRYGPVWDDWDLLRMAVDNRFISVDVTRPIAFLTPVLTYHLADGSLPLMYAQITLLHIVEAILMFELLRRVLAVWLRPSLALYFAFIGAAVYVFYPTDVTHHIIVMIHGRYQQIAILLIALIWFHVTGGGRRIWLIAALALLAFNLFTKEHAYFLYFLLPGFILYHGHKPWQRRWLAPVALWFGVLIVYGLWRFLYVPSLNPDMLRQVELRNPLEMLVGFVGTFYQMIGNIYLQTAQEHTARISEGSTLWWLPVAALVFSVIVIAIMARLTGLRSALPDAVVRRRGGWLTLTGLAIFIGGVAPYLFFGIAVIDIRAALSRNTQLMTLSATLLAIVLPFTAHLLVRRFARLKVTGYGLEVALVTMLGVALLTTALVRQVNIGAASLVAWEEQRSYWYRIFDIPLDIPHEDGPLPLDEQPEMLVFVDDFPRLKHGANFTMYSWAFNAGLYIMADRQALMVPYFELIQDVWYDEDGLSVRLNVVSHTNRPPITWVYPLERVRRLVYDPDLRDVRLTVMPGAYIEGDAPEFFTGSNTLAAPLQVNAFGRHILGDYVPPPVCRTLVTVRSEDAAPERGVAVLLDADGQRLDRRPIERGDPLAYNLLAPCDSPLTLQFEISDGAPVILPPLDGPYVAGNGTESAPLRVAFGD